MLALRKTVSIVFAAVLAAGVGTAVAPAAAAPGADALAPGGVTGSRGTGGEVVDGTRYVALGDSYSSGFGVTPYFPGTNRDGTANDCRRSTRAYGPLVAEAEDLDLAFHACQGAVTGHFFVPRNLTWGEAPQLAHLTDDTGLVTVGIGGNDAGFPLLLAQCLLGTGLLPFDTCYREELTVPVAAAMARLDGRAAAPVQIVPYDELYQAMRRGAPAATTVAVGYPSLYPAAGGDRPFLPGGRCDGVTRADQRWIVEQITELNEIIERNAAANGFLYAEPDFTGHELCGEGEEWIFGLLSPGRIHPTAEGQVAMAGAVLDALDDGFERFEVLPGQTVTSGFEVGPGSPFVSLVTGWSGGDVSLTLVSPSGEVYDRAGDAGERETGATWERVRVADPEAGTWTAKLHGVDGPVDGEQVTLSVYVAEPPNARPVADVVATVDSGDLVLDASGSTDADGTVTRFDWYVTTADGGDVLQGATVRLPLTDVPERTVTLVITDDEGLTAFEETRWLPLDVKPGSHANRINLRSRGVTPMALLSSATFDATTVDRTTIAVGPGGAPPRQTAASAEDVDGDGDLDQVLHVWTQELGLTAGDEQLCLTGTLPDGQSFVACDAVRVR